MPGTLFAGLGQAIEEFKKLPEMSRTHQLKDSWFHLGSKFNKSRQHGTEVLATRAVHIAFHQGGSREGVGEAKARWREFCCGPAGR